MRIINIALFIGLWTVTAKSYSLFSPNHVLELELKANANGELHYNLSAEGFKIINEGNLGFVINKNENLYSQFTIDSVRYDEHNSTWETVWGEVKTIQDNYNRLTVYVHQLNTSKKLKIEFRLFNDGLGFRYDFYIGSGLDYFIVEDELTSFGLQEDYNTYWIPGDYDSNEYRYNKTRLSKVNALEAGEDHNIAFRHNVHDSLVQTPLLCLSDFGYTILIHEAALRHYPAMQLDVNRQTKALKCHLVPDAIGNKAYLQEGDVTPWRVILFAKKNKELLTNHIILNLNEASPASNNAYIKPGKFVGVWWEMHVGKSSWNYWTADNSFSKQYWKQASHHGANTKNVMRYIDFASKNNIPYVLVEGWNEGWENWFGRYREHIFSFTKPYPDFDIQKINEYAEKKNVRLIMHHETSGAVTDYERQLDSALHIMHEYNYPGIKGGYVGYIIPRGEYHDGQWMIDHYERLAKTMAAHKFTLDLHESVRPTGLHRTYPNWWSNEAARGNEFNAWSRGNLPEHETILPFTRLMGGPMDYTPGIFNIKMNTYDNAKTEQVHTTLAKQLALYVTMYSPIQMAADLIENYEKKPDAFEFIKNVPTDWDTTIVLDAEPGDYIYMARKQRNTNNWYLGAITDENERMADIDFSFLDKGKKYKLILYKDGSKADWELNPELYEIEKSTIRSSDKLRVRLAKGGGCAMEIIALGK